MTSVDWYYAKGNKQYGPVTPAELKQLADRGEVGPEELVWRDGMEDWVAARRVKGLFDGDPSAAPAESAPAPAAPAAPITPRGSETFERSAAAFERARERNARHPFDVLLEIARAQFTGPFVAATARLFGLAGYYGLYAAMIAAVTFQAAWALKTNQPVWLLLGIAQAVALVVLQYTAGRFSGALERLGGVTSGRMTSAALLDCFALANIALGLLALLGLSVLAVWLETFALLFPAVATFVVCQYAAAVALNPETLNLTITSDANAGEEAVAVFSFFAQLLLRLVPVGLGLGVVWGTLRLGYASFLVFRSSPLGLSTQPGPSSPAGLPPELTGDLPIMGLLGELSGGLGGQKSLFSALTQAVSAQEMAVSAFFWLVVSAALPILAYLAFLLCHLAIDLMRTLLVLPGKLDAVAQERSKGAD